MIPKTTITKILRIIERMTFSINEIQKHRRYELKLTGPRLEKRKQTKTDFKNTHFKEPSR